MATLFAEALYERSEDYIRFHQNFLSEISGLKLERTNELIIGLQSGFSEGFGKDFLADFIIQNQDLTIRVRSYAKPRLAEAMEQKDIPVWIVTGNYNESLFHSLHSKKNKLFLLAAEKHPLALKEKVLLADLQAYPLIGLTHDIGQKGRTNTEISKNRLKAPDNYLNSSDRNLIMKLVQSGIAVSFNAGWQYREYPGIVALPLADLHVEVELHVLLRNDVAVNPSIRRLIKYIQNFRG